MLGGSLVKRVLVHDGAVGARLIQASIHARRDGGGAVKLLPSAGDLVYPGRWRFLRLGEEALHGTVLSLQSFWHHPQLSSLVVFVSFHSIVPQVATNRGPVTDLIRTIRLNKVLGHLFDGGRRRGASKDCEARCCRRSHHSRWQQRRWRSS